MRTLDIEIIDVEKQTRTSANGKSYESLNVTHKFYFNGKPDVKGKTILNIFPEVFKTLSNAVKGETYQVVIEKNDKGFLDWVEVSRQDGSVAKTEVKGEAPVAVGEKAALYAEQEATKQRMIVRQSSLKAAVDFSNAAANNNLDDVLAVASAFEAWVLR